MSSDAPHRRHNPLNDSWVIVSPHRAARPWLGQVDEPEPVASIAHDPACYLCPGNARVGGAVNPDYAGVHIFENDFPALMPGGGPDAAATVASDGGGHPLLRADSVSGTCRVICFSPDHSRTLPLWSIAGRASRHSLARTIAGSRYLKTRAR